MPGDLFGQGSMSAKGKRTVVMSELLTVASGRVRFPLFNVTTVQKTCAKLVMVTVTRIEDKSSDENPRRIAPHSDWI